MSTVPTDRVVTALRASLKETERLRKHNRQLLAALRDPVAIVGIGCRYPGGVDSPEALWELAIGGVDAISQMPSNRGWDLDGVYDPNPDHPGTSYTREGGFLHDAGEFDADFFGISPREALAMDPQQRLLLEVSWEAIEDAGINPAALRGTATGVFAGSMYQDYGGGMAVGVDDDLNLMAGASSSVVSGRIAYALGLEGPAVSIDTACSSSLVAVHLGCQSLRSGECSLALAGGVTVLSTPGVFVSFSRQRALAPDGRCKPFADSANGTSVSEGVGVVLLERLADARRHGHRVLAVIRGSAVNQDGASNGLTAPNGPAQERVIRQSLASAALAPADVDVVEAHGTGTTLGDPIEAQALLSTYGRERPDDRPLWLGSVKSNIGHTQAAAGAAGLIKMVMALRRGALPPTLHVDAPSSHVDWSAGAVSLLTQGVPWERDGRPRRAGVSSFGISGTNAHMILEEAPPEDAPATEPEPAPKSTGGSATHSEGAGAQGAGSIGADVLPWVLSGKSEAALRAQAERLRARASSDPDASLADVGFSLSCTRAVHQRRAVLLGRDRDEFLGLLDALAEGRSATGLLQGVAGSGGGVVFVFPGQGSQWDGMAVELLDGSPVFAQAMSECGAALAPHVEWSLEGVLRGEPGAPGLERVDVVQPVLFAVMVSLARLWRAFGVVPVAVVGHSQGEIAAAHVAGGLSLEDAARIVALRSLALVALAGRGGMVSVALEVGKLEELLQGFGQAVSVAAVNGPRSVVVSGEPEALGELLATCEAGGIRAKRIPVDYAAHSPHVEEIRQELLEGCSSIVPRSAELPFYSTVTGEATDTVELDGAYWYENLRQTVRLEAATRALLKGGYGAFVEISPHPVLAVGVQETIEAVVEGGEDAVNGSGGRVTAVERIGGHALAALSAGTIGVTGSLRRGEGGPTRFLASLGEAWVSGVEVAWGAVFEGLGARVVPLPKYAFQRRRYWLDAPPGAGDMLAVGQAPAAHPLLGAAVALAGGEERLFTARLSLQTHPWLADHVVMGAIVFPGAALLELALHAGAQLGCRVVRELTLEAPLILDDHGAVQIQMMVGAPDDGGARALTIHSRLEQATGAESLTGDAWVRNADGVLAPAVEDRDSHAFLMGGATGDVWPPVGAEPIETAGLYDRLAELGMDYGPSFQGLRAAWRRGEEVFAEVSLCEERRPEASLFGVHPGLLDAALHGVAAKLLEAGSDEGQAEVLLPFACGELEVYRSGVASARVSLSPAGEGAVSVSAVDEYGEPVFAMRSLALRPVSEGQLRGASAGSGESLFGVDWITLAPPPQGAARPAVIGPEAATLAAAFEGRAPRLGGDQVEYGAPVAELDVHAPADAHTRQVEVHEDLAGLSEAIAQGAPAPAVVLAGFGLRADTPSGLPSAGAGETAPHTPGGGGPELAQATGGVLERAHGTAHAALALAQAWLADPRLAESRLVLFTRLAQSVRAGEDPHALTAASVWGLVRSAQSEHPERFVLIDVDDVAACKTGLDAALAGNEPQIAVRDGIPLAPRLAPVASPGVLQPPPGFPNWRLSIGRTGTLEDLHLAPCSESEAPLGPMEVRVAVRAAGLNFRDVVATLGLVPLDGGRDVIGSEGAGVVLEVGSAVSDMVPGDRVMGLMFGAFGPVVVADRRRIAPLPEGWSFARAAATSGVFMTAYYALIDLARLQRGERLLVHAAAGGVGMAAVQIAQYLGAEVFATANPGKWEVLRSLGLDDAHIASTRELDFARRFLETSEGEGMDVVLNSLAREFVDASLELLPRGGRFVEMGKTDIRDARQVAQAHPGVRYGAFDLVDAGEERCQEMLVEILELFRRGVLTALPLRAWDIRRAPEAFRFMSQARHVGKIVLTLPDPPLGTSGAVLVTGGTGELGGLVAKHLVAEHGVRSLVLASRRGRDAPGATELEADLLALGARVVVKSCDVADRRELAALIESLEPEFPLKAVVHTAGVLDDGVIESLTGEQLDRVLAPKMDAAWHLHELTAHLDLDAFLLFSSVSGTIGGPGQGNYAAGNAFLDALAAHRRAQGLPAVSMAWGGWSQMSEMTGQLSESDLARVKRAGVRAFTTAEALEAFDAARGCGEGLTVPLRLDPVRLRAQARAGVLPALLSGLVRGPRAGAPHVSAGSLAGRLEGVAAGDRARVTLDLIRSEVAVVLGHDSPDAIEPRRAFRDLGFDSLMAVELRNRLNAITGLRLPATLVFDYPSPAELAVHLLGEVDVAGARPSASVAARRALEEPVAIVAMGCRYPGAVSSPQELWELVAAGVDAISAFPTDRGWDVERLYDPDPDRPGASYAREGGFMHDLGDFDSEFFQISPREALMMDPQQRFLLEVAWETFERGGIAPDSLHGSQTGVFVGTTSQDYSTYALSALDGSEAYLLTGTSASVLSGRVAYALGLEGPAVTIDTACSSSLVAMHMACAALRGGECSLALAGGVTALCTPLPFVTFSRQRGLAADGRCKSFADAADGTGVSEGIGLVLLERLSDARRLGHPVLAVVRGSAVNQDGASNGLSAPNGPAQQRVIGQALANAGLSPAEVDAVEAHGTGTTLGDPIEAQALLATYGRERPSDRPLWLGSIKSNIAHTQAAAGVGGVIKMVMAMRHGLLPKTLHVDRPSTQVDWSAGEVSLLTEARPWLRNGRPRRAGVSSFGVSGTNAHLILEEASSPEQGEAGASDGGSAGGAQDVGVVPFVLSASGRESLRAQAARLHSFVSARESISMGDVGSSLATRATHENRAVVLGNEPSELLAGLAALAAGEGRPNVLEGAVAAAAAGRLAFLFTGQGAQRVGMGSELYMAFPRFASALEEVCARLDAELGGSLLDVLFATEGSPLAEQLDDTMFTQAGLFALEVALFRLLEGLGVTPAYLIGHSIGELAAGHVAGVFALEDACRLVAARGRLMSALPRDGAMIAVQASPQEAAESLAGLEDRVSVAAVNGPSSVVLSGEEEALLEVAAEWERRGRKLKRLRVSHAFHSPLMEQMLEQFGEVARGISYAPPRIPIVSNLTGRPAVEELSSSEYWIRQVRETVRFAEGIGWLGSQGIGSFLEIGPDGVLSAMARDCLSAAPDGTASASFAVAVLRAGRPEALSLLSALAEVWTRGGPVDWGAVFGGEGSPLPDMPTYAFQRRRYWLGGASGDTSSHSPAGAIADQPVLGAETRFWEAVEGEELEDLAQVLGLEGEHPRSSLGAVLPSLSSWHRQSRERSTVSRWCYGVDWKPLALAPASALSGTWLMILPTAAGSEQEWFATLAASLGARCERLVAVHVDGAAGREEIARALREALDELGDEREVRSVVSLLALQEEPLSTHPSVPAGLAGTVALAQALDDLTLPAPVWLLTRSAVSVAPSERLCSPTQAQVWGLGRVLGLERPQRLGGSIDLPATLDERVLTLLAGVLDGAGSEDQVAVRGAGVFARRLVRARSVRPISGSAAKRAEEEGPAGVWTPPPGTVMITGGTGGLGAHVARWLAGIGAQRLLLVSRRGEDAPGVRELCAQLREMGAETAVAACDVADRDRLANLIESLPESHPLGAVVHAAGVGDLGGLDSLGVADLQRALSAKARGAFNLDVLTQHLDLRAFVLFSSIAGTLGSAEQGAYAAANAYLDALAAERRARGLTATSIAWGAWAGDGMAGVAERQLGDALRRHGLHPMAPGLAVEALNGALLRDEAYTVVADIRWDTYAPLFASARGRPLIEDLPEVQAALHAGARAGASAAGQELQRGPLEASPEKRERLALEWVRVEVARVLGHASSETIDGARPFKELGFDSLLAVELRNRLSDLTGLDLPATLVFDYPTPGAVAALLLSELTGEESPDGGRVDTELARLERTLLSLEDPAERRGASARLQAVVAKLDGARDGSEQREPQDGVAVAARLLDASDDELFGFIDQQLGTR